MDENFSHRVKSGTPLALHYVEKTSTVTVHKAGCKHAADRVRDFDGHAEADDFFNVAPCARAK
jgi:hypothetical protein